MIVPGTADTGPRRAAEEPTVAAEAKKAEG